MASYLITKETMQEHRARWFVYAGGNGVPLQKIPHTANMRGSWPGWDVTCSCGKWESRQAAPLRPTSTRNCGSTGSRPSVRRKTSHEVGSDHRG